jgi:hypothetical protein
MAPAAAPENEAVPDPVAVLSPAPAGIGNARTRAGPDLAAVPGTEA